MEEPEAQKMRNHRLSTKFLFKSLPSYLIYVVKSGNTMLKLWLEKQEFTNVLGFTCQLLMLIWFMNHHVLILA